MADDSVQVKLGADVSAAKAGMEDGSRSIAASLAGIQKALENFGTSNRKVTEDALKNNADLSRSFLELKASTTSGFNAITGVIERFRGVLGTLAAALAGGAIFKGAVDSMLNLEGAVRGLIISFGMTAEKATQTAVALRLAGISADTYEQMGQRVGRVLKTQSEEFDRLGVKTKDASGNLLPMDAILRNIYERMQDFKAGTDQTEFALSTVGRNAKDFASDMERLTGVSDRATQMMRDLNIEMGPDRIAQIERYRVDLNAFGVVMEEVGTKIGEAVLPRLEGLAAWFNEYGPTAATYFLNVVKALITLLQSLGAALATIAIVGTAAFKDLVTEATAAWQSIKAAASFNFSAIPGIMAEANAKTEANAKATAAEIVRTWEDAADKVNRMWAGSAAPPIAAGGRTGLPRSGNDRFRTKPTGSGDDQIAGLENELKAEQDAFNKRMLLQGSFQTWSIEQTRDYWEEVLSITNLTAKERQAAENKYYDAERQVQQRAFAAYLGQLEDEKAALGHNIDAKIAIEQKEYDAIVQRYGREAPEAAAAYKKLVELRQQLADQRERIAEIEQKAEEATAKFAISMNKLAADQAVALRQISAAQRLAIERDFITQEYDAEAAGLRARIALLAADPTADPKELAARKAELLTIEQNYQLKLTQIDNAAVLEREKYAIQAQDAITASISNTLAALVTNAKNWKQTMLDALKQLDDALVKIAANQIVQQYLGPGTSGGSFLSGLTSKIFGAGAGGSASGGAAAATSANTAAVTANTAAQTTATATATLLDTSQTVLITALSSLTAAVTANTAALSTNAGGGLFAGGAAGMDFGGMLGDLASFDVGSAYVPNDMLAFVHRGEAIIPAAQNRGGSAGATIVNNTFLLPGTMDTRTQAQIARASGRSVEDARRRS